MAHLPSQTPQLAIHLTDRTTTPIISSGSTASQSQSLSSLSTTALAAHDTLQRLDLGAPQRSIVEYGSGALQITSYLNPPASANTNAGQLPISGLSSPSVGQVNGVPGRSAAPESSAPMLIALVVAPGTDQMREARRAVSRLERVGKEFQTEWMAEEMREEDGGSGD